MQTKPLKSQPRGPWRRRILRTLAVLAGAMGIYLAFVLHPQPLFAYTLERGNVVLHAREPFPPEANAMLEDVVDRLSRSPLDDKARTHDVFLCDTPALFAFFTLWGRNAGGVTHTWAFGNAFIRPADVRRGRVIGARGREKEGDRTLTYYITHEVAHAMTADRVGRLAFQRLAAFQVEGYADYVGFAKPVDLARGRTDLLAETPDMNPSVSGHYDRYRLLVGYLLQKRGWSVDEVLAKRLDRAEVERELRDADL